jgi:hypothetical protein
MGRTKQTAVYPGDKTIISRPFKVASNEEGMKGNALQSAWELIEAETKRYLDDCVKANIISTADAKWYNDNEHGQFALIIEMVDEEKLQKDGRLQSYKNTIGQRGGWILNCINTGSIL